MTDRAQAPIAGSPARVAILLLALVAAEAGLLLASGRLVVTTYEMDALHLLDGMARVRLGEVPHLDFRTPLGALAFVGPAALAGTPGRALALASVVAGLLCVLLATWLAASRLRVLPALALGGFAALLAMAMMAGETVEGASPAMIYNRWGWAALMLCAPLTVLPPVRPGGRTDLLDALAFGLAGALLLFLKASFAAALAPLWLGWLVLGGRARAALLALGVGLVASVLLGWALGGLAAAQGYWADLVDVATSPTRARPGRPLPGVVARPEALAPVLATLLGALALARGGLRREAAALLLFLAACALAAWQNWGNELTGLLAAAILLLAAAPRTTGEGRLLGLPARRAAETAAAVLLALAAPVALNAQRSLAVALAVPPGMARLAPDAAPDMLWSDPEEGPRVSRPLDPALDRGAVVIGGERLEGCALATAYARMTAEGAAVLRGDPALAGRTTLALDVTNALWLLGGGPPLKGGYLWLYGESGEAMRRAAILAVPLCPSAPRARAFMVEEATRLGLDLHLVRRSAGWAFFENRSAPNP